MFVCNGLEFRSLEDQVLFLTQKVAEHYAADRILANFGIRIVGSVESSTDLPAVGKNFGDAYVVGSGSDITIYIWAEPDEYHPEAYWIGPIPIAVAGPAGPAPEIALEGDYIIAIDPTDGSKTRIISKSELMGQRGRGFYTYVNDTGGSPGVISTAITGDLYMNMSEVAGRGTVYEYGGSNAWILRGSLMGPQGIQGVQGPEGPQGPRGYQGNKGEKGDVGGLYDVRGIVNSVDGLPNPSSLGSTRVAYLVGEAPPYDLYIQIGSSPVLANWHNAGPFNAATLVTIAGIGQNVWDADTKVDKLEPEYNGNRYLYMQTNGVEQKILATNLSVPATIPFRDLSNSFRVGNGADDPPEDRMDNAINALWVLRRMEEAKSATVSLVNKTTVAYAYDISPWGIAATSFNNPYFARVTAYVDPTSNPSLGALLSVYFDPVENPDTFKYLDAIIQMDQYNLLHMKGIAVTSDGQFQPYEYGPLPTIYIGYTGTTGAVRVCYTEQTNA